jgi:tetratricopeptide (TPR) repeat protein
LLTAARKLWLADRHDEALAAFRAALRRRPDDLRLAVEVASYLGLRFEIDEATSQLQRCESLLEGNPEGLYQVGWAYQRCQRPDDALRCFRRALQQSPAHPGSVLQVSDWHERRGQWQLAEAALEPLLRRQPVSAEAPLRFARLRRRQGDWEQAERILQRLVDAHCPEAARVAAWYELAESLDRRGQAGTSAADALDALGGEHLAACRRRYLQRMGAALNTAPDLWLLDKNPSITSLISPFRRLFPQAPVLFALRVPRDVVVSCFLRHLPWNRSSETALCSLRGSVCSPGLISIPACPMRTSKRCRARR